MKYNIRDRHGDKVIYTAEIEADENTPDARKLRLAVIEAVKNSVNLQEANLRGAILRGADLRGAYLRDADLRYAILRGADLRDADLRGAYLRDADLRVADLRDADLRVADLRDADLRVADLRYANLRYANLQGAVLQGANLQNAFLQGAILEGSDLVRTTQRSDGRVFYFIDHPDVLWILAGCRWFKADDAEAHWKKTRGGTQLGRESLEILHHARAMAEITKDVKEERLKE